MRRTFLLVACLGVALALGACKKQPAEQKDPGPAAAMDELAQAMDAMDPMAGARPEARPGPRTAARPGARPAGSKPLLAGEGGGLSDPEVIGRAVAVSKEPVLGAKGFTADTGAPNALCQAFVAKLVACRLMPPHVAPAQANMCAQAAAKKPEFKGRLGFLPKLSCDHLARITRPPVVRGVAVKDGQGVGIITEKMLQQLGRDMIEEAAAQHGKDEANTLIVQSMCDKVYEASKRLGRADVKPVCVAIKAPSFNAMALGGHILFHTTAVEALANLAIAQIALASDLAGYQKYQITLGAHVITGKPLAQWPVPGCKTGDAAGRAARLKDAKVHARFEGLLVAILGHELGHLIHGHARRKLVRAEVLRVNASQFAKLSRGKKLAFIHQLGSMALSQADEYESDEASLRFLQAYWQMTTDQFKQSTGDGLMGPHPMDIVYVALFMQSLKDAVKLLTNKDLAPALVNSHPASHARADRALRVIIANEYAGHPLAKAAYQMLILGKRG